MELKVAAPKAALVYQARWMYEAAFWICGESKNWAFFAHPWSCCSHLRTASTRLDKIASSP